MSLRRLLKSVLRDLLPYAELDFRTQSGLHLYVPDRGAWSSAGEVYFSRVYDPFYPHLSGVRRWVDLGCNHGFFSFGLLDYLFRQNHELPETKVILADANEVCVARMRSAIETNALQSRWQCRHAVIGPPDTTVTFLQNKDSLGSNIFGHGRNRSRALHYRTTDIGAMLATQSGLFDLIKIDIEGAEQYLFAHHLDFLKRFRYGLCEWHGPTFPGPKLKASLQPNWRVIELRSQGLEHNPRIGHSWDSPAGMVLWENLDPIP